MIQTRVRAARPWLVVLLCPLSAGILRAQAVAPPLPPVDPRISHVVTGGHWRAGDQEGGFRAVVLSAGFEHVISHLYIEWVSDETETAAARVVASKAVDTVSAGGWSLGSPRLSRDDGQWHVAVDGVNSHFDPPRRGRWIVTVGAPGIVSVRRAPP